MNTQDFTKTIVVNSSPKEAFETIMNVRSWWTGLFNEHITGHSERIGDEFSFSAGDGVHFSKQRLIELIPYKKIVWLVTESNLSFLTQTDEWNNTKICFDIAEEAGKTQLTFTHSGLLPQIECYGSCTKAWTMYLDKMAEM